MKKKKVAIIIFLICLVLIAVLAIAVSGYVSSKLDLINYDDGIPQTPLSEEDANRIAEESSAFDDSFNTDELESYEAPIQSTLEEHEDDRIINIILIGTDERAFDFQEHARADSITLLSLNCKEGSAKLVSFERGIGMPITAGEYEGKYDLITHIFAYGGADMVVSDIRDNFKIDVDKYVRVNLNALIKVIDALGGVTVELTEREALYLNGMLVGGSSYGYLNHGFYRGDAGSEEHEFVVGENDMSGVMALAYARLRAIDSNWSRVVRQRNIIQAISNKLKNADIATLNKLCDEVLPLVQTNLTKDDIKDLILIAPKFLGIQFDQMTMPEKGSFGYMQGIWDHSMIALDFEKNSKILREFIYGVS